MPTTPTRRPYLNTGPAYPRGSSLTTEKEPANRSRPWVWWQIGRDALTEPERRDDLLQRVEIKISKVG
jgi:hypothetical protein